MSVEALTIAWKYSNATLGCRLVIVALADYANDNFECWPSVQTLAKKSKLSERNTRLCLRKLEESGEIVTIQNNGQNGSNRYRITITPGQNCPPGQNLPPEKHDRHGGKNAQESMSDIAPKPSIEPSKDKPSNRVEFPEALNYPEFADAWDQWKTFRSELKKKLTPSTEKKQLALLASFGLQGAIRSINQSIEKGWQGLFAPKMDSRNNVPIQKPPGVEDDHEARYGFKRGAIPLSQRPPPGEDEAGNKISREEWEERFPLSLYDHDK